MNSSQLLYKISDLKYTIRRKEVEYGNAVKAHDQLTMDLNSAALTLLKEDLANTVKAFDSIPTDNPASNAKSPKKTRKWQSFFNLKAATNKK
jgi:hypothetical protein